MDYGFRLSYLVFILSHNIYCDVAIGNGRIRCGALRKNIPIYSNNNILIHTIKAFFYSRTIVHKSQFTIKLLLIEYFP
jgi:hypothetical protein